jgi:hypothetical protein
MEVNRSLALQVARDHPGRFLAANLRRDANNLLPAVTDLLRAIGVDAGSRGTLAVLNRQGVIGAARHYFGSRLWLLIPLAPWILLWLGMIGLGLVGLVRIWRSSARAAWILLGGVPLCLLLVPGAASVPRFSAPAAPFFALAAGTMLAHRRRGAGDGEERLQVGG